MSSAKAAIFYPMHGVTKEEEYRCLPPRGTYLQPSSPGWRPRRRSARLVAHEAADPLAVLVQIRGPVLPSQVETTADLRVLVEQAAQVLVTL